MPDLPCQTGGRRNQRGEKIGHAWMGSLCKTGKHSTWPFSIPDTSFLKKKLLKYIWFTMFFKLSCTATWPSHTYTAIFFIFHQVLIQKNGYSSLCHTAGPHHPFILNVTVCIYQPQTPHQTPSLHPCPSKHKSALLIHDLFLFCRQIICVLF